MPRYRQPPTLTEAIYRKDWERVDKLLELGADPNDAFPCYRSDRRFPTLPLVEAVEQGNVEMMRKLIEAGANPEGKSSHVTPASKAITNGRLDLLKILVQAGARMNRYYTFGGLYDSYLEEACAFSHPDIVEWLIDQGANPCERRVGGWSLVHSTIQNGISAKDKEVLRVLRDRGANLLAVGGSKDDKERHHAISYVAAFGDGEMIQWFLDAGADANLVRNHSIRGDGWSGSGEGLPLVAGVLMGQGKDKAGMLQALVAHGARLDVQINFNIHTMGPCCELSSKKNAQDAPSERIMGGSYLTLSAGWGDVDSTQALISLGMDANHVSQNGITPLLAFSRHAGRGQYKDALEKLRVLLDAGANVTDNAGNTILHHFASFAQLMHNNAQSDLVDWPIACIALLLERGADATACNREGQTPLDVSRTGKQSNPAYELIMGAHQQATLQAVAPKANSVRVRTRF